MTLKQWATRHTAALALAIFAFLVLMPPPLMPEEGLDMSWVLAAEHAAREGRMFGQDFIFTYGPFAVLSTHLFDPATYAIAILGDLLITGLFLLPLLWSRRPFILALYVAAILGNALTPYSFDARMVAAFLALFLFSLRDRGWAALVLAALVSPFLLSKFSYALVALPLLGLADAYRLAAWRRVPLLLPIAVSGMVLGMLATGHKLALLPLLAANIWQVIGGYSGAMQAELGGLYTLFAAWGAMTLLGAAYLWMAARRRSADGEMAGWPIVAAALLGIAWALFAAMKMGHVRQGVPIFITWNAFVLTLPIVAAFFDSWRPLAKAETRVLGGLIAACLMPIVALDGAMFAHFNGPNPLAYLGQRAERIGRRPIDALALLTPQRWRAMTEQRQAAEAQIARRLPATMTGTADVIPYTLAPVILSSMRYQPRPVPQSYSAYTPRLQSLDAAFFENNATAPATLFLGVGDIDDRLPTLATGPTLLVAARWYDAVGTSPIGLVLRRRNAPRPYRAQNLPARDFAVGDWVPVPAAPGGLVVASVEIDRNLLGRLFGFLARDPILHITTRCEDGAEHSFRFVPGMARIGFVLSPMKLDPDPADLRGSAATIERNYAPDAACLVVAFRIWGDGLATRAYRPGRVAFQAVALEPGFTRALPR